jgi:Tol biopolymer transport system component
MPAAYGLTKVNGERCPRREDAMRRLMRAVTIAAALCTLLLLVAAQADATYRGKNGLIAFSLEADKGYQINTISPNGEGLHQITSVAGSALDSDWSPDGTKIVFDVDHPAGAGFPCRSEMMNADGTNVVALTPSLVVAHHGCVYNPSFTPNGKRLVFVEQRCHNEIRCHRTIRSMDVDGGDRRPILGNFTLLPHGGYDLHAPRVSPDGRTVLFVVVNEMGKGYPEHERKALYSVRMNGTHLHQVVPFRFDVCVCGGDWAPDGNRIVSSTQAGPRPVPGVASNLFTERPDGTGLRYITHSRNTAVYLSVGTYSPNGRWIMYKQVTAKEKYRLMKIHPSGRDRSLIARLPANFLNRDWGPQPS